MNTGHDVLGWRQVLAIIGPSTNTVVQPEMEALRPPGVTNHYRAFHVEDTPLPLTDAAFHAGVAGMSDSLAATLRMAMSCRPHAVLLGISVLSFAGGLPGALALQRQLQEQAGVPVMLGSLALASALQALGALAAQEQRPPLRRLALLTPYFPSANQQVARFFNDCGFVVVRDVALQVPHWTAIARVTPEAVDAALLTLQGDDVDAFVQVGTNLPIAGRVAMLEQRLGKPVLAVNVATYWRALRALGIDDTHPEQGCLMQRC
jgi:maleate isomerase